MSHSSPCDVCEIHGSFPVTTCSIILRFLQRLPILGCRGITMWHTWSCAPQSLVSRWHAGGSTFCWSERNWFGIQMYSAVFEHWHLTAIFHFQMMPPKEYCAEVNLEWWPVPRKSWRNTPRNPQRPALQYYWSVQPPVLKVWFSSKLRPKAFRRT